MRKINLLIIILILPFFINSCKTNVRLDEAGRLTIASTKNTGINGEYVLLERNAGFDESQRSILNGKRRSKGKGTRRSQKLILENFDRLLSPSIDGAMNNVVEGTAGGVYMENVEVFIAKKHKRRTPLTRTSRNTKSKNLEFIVSGDVYGIKGQSKNIRGFIVGTKALYRKKVGTVSTLIDDQYCLWKDDKSDKFIQVLYDDLIKIGE